MNCPPEVADVLLAILHTGLLRIRALAWSNDGRRCAVEADHLHNLPSLLTDYSSERLRYYWDAERAAFVNQSGKEDVAAFEAAWDRLKAIVADELLPTPAD